MHAVAPSQTTVALLGKPKPTTQINNEEKVNYSQFTFSVCGWTVDSVMLHLLANARLQIEAHKRSVTQEGGREGQLRQHGSLPKQ